MEQTGHKKKKKWLKILVLFLIVGAVCGGGAAYHFFHSGSFMDDEMNEYIRLPDYRAMTGGSLTDGQKEQVWQEIIQESEVLRYPKKEKAACRERAEAYYLTLAEGYGYTEEDFPEFLEEIYSWTTDEYEDSLEQYTESLMKEELVVYAVAQQEGLAVSSGEYEGHLKEILKEAGYDEEGFQDIFGMTVAEYAEENGIRTELLKEKVFSEIFQ